MKKRSFIYGALLVSAGVYIGAFHARLPLLTLNHEVDILEAGNLFAVLALAIIVPFAITSKLDIKRSEKDLLIEEIAVFSKELELLENYICSLENKQVSRNETQKVQSLFKRLGEHLTSITGQFTNIKNPVVIEEFSKLRKQLTNYWICVTGDNGLKPTGFQWSNSFYLRQSREYNKIAAHARRLKFAINNS